MERVISRENASNRLTCFHFVDIVEMSPNWVVVLKLLKSINHSTPMKITSTSAMTGWIGRINRRHYNPDQTRGGRQRWDTKCT